jgi:hypothetical protein
MKDGDIVMDMVKLPYADRDPSIASKHKAEGIKALEMIRQDVMNGKKMQEVG